MKRATMMAAAILCAACSGGEANDSDSAGPATSVFDSVDQAKLEVFLREITGDVDASVDGQSYGITERWSPEGKKRFREFWKQYFSGLGAQIVETTFPIPNLVGETEGHNVEAVFPGASPDSLVIVAHYDTVG